MPRTQLEPVVGHLYRMAGADRGPGRTDAELLRHFVEHREEAAFALLLERHGGLVMRVCRRILPRPHDAEDAFQATFLTLINHASSIRQTEAVGSWLYRVAHRIAIKAGMDMAKRSARERQSVRPSQTAPSSETALRELQAVLDEEVQRLPEKWRAPFLLCCLEGKTRTEAAQELGWKEGTVAGRLAEARKRLQQRLARRGVVLAGALTVLALTSGTEAAPARGVLDSTLGAALQFTTGQTAGDAISPSVAALVQGVTRTMLITKAKLMTAVLLMLGFLTAGLLAHRAFAAKEPPAFPDAAAASEGGLASADARADENKQHADGAKVELNGRVLDAEGKPVAGAQLFLATPAWREGNRAKPGVRATTGDDGCFRFSVGREELADGTQLIATARDRGLDWVKADPAGGELTLKCVKDTAIDGRVLDLQGRPVAGVAITVDQVQTPPAEDLTPAFADWQRDMQGALNRLSKGLYQPDVAGFLLPVKTDADGRFRIPGIGPERLVVLKLRGDTIQHKTLYVFCRSGKDVANLTKPNPDNKMPGMPQRAAATVVGPTFEYVASPSKPIVGIVRDKATGKPLADVFINGSAGNHHWADYATTQTDSEGRFRLLGVAKGHDYMISAFAKGGKTYLPGMKKVGDTEGLEPLTVDFELVRGVLVKGHITDKTTGKPVESALWYNPLADNKYFRDLPGNDWYRSVSQGHRTDKDGAFSLLALPGSGLILVRAEDEAMKLYTQAIINPADRAKAYRENEAGLGDSFLSAGGSIEHLYGHHAYRLIDPEQNAETIECNVELDRGLSRSGTVVDPEGKPLAGATVVGLEALGGGATPLKDPSFTAQALNPARPRRLSFVHKERQLVGSVSVRGDEQEPVTVKMEPWGIVIGRALDEEGNPLAEANFNVHYQDNSTRWLFEAGREQVKTDREGRFRIEGLFPGMPFGIGFVKKGTIYDAGNNYRKLTVKPGQTNDLGDVKTKIYRLE
jgi:RNA polymerase sigma factor (sigma-70 family)